MPKIETSGYFDNISPNRRGRSSSSSSAPTQLSFKDMLTRAKAPLPTEESTELPDTIEELLDVIHNQGAKLARERSWSALQSYRRLIQHFIQQVVGNAIDIEQHLSGHDVVNRKRFSLVTIINKRLNELAEGIQSAQSSQLELLHSTGEIFGLLVDLHS